MKYRTSIGSAAAVFCAASCICAAADGPAKAVVSAAEIGTAVQASAATVVFGAGLATPVSTFAPQLFERTWTSHGASGGTEADEGGWRAFTMQTSKLQGAPVVRGRARFSENGDGTVRGEWIAVPDADAPLAELCVSGNFDLVPFAGGTALVDGKAVAIPADCKDMHVFRGPVSTLVLRDRAGEDRLRVAFDGTTRVLLQDNRAWGGNNFSLRFFFAEGPVSGGTEYAVRATFATPADGLLVLNDGRPVTLAAGADWIPVANEPWIESGSALDFSEVVPHHAPAGKYGRVVAVGDHFEFENRPGVPQRFYGVNICGDANTPSTPEAAEKFALLQFAEGLFHRAGMVKIAGVVRRIVAGGQIAEDRVVVPADVEHPFALRGAGEFHVLIDDVGRVVPPLVGVVVAAVGETVEAGDDRRKFFHGAVLSCCDVRR